MWSPTVHMTVKASADLGGGGCVQAGKEQMESAVS